MRFLGQGVFLALALGACGKKETPPPPGPPQVAVLAVQRQPATLTTILPGRTSAYETSEVRPQVNGLVLARLFREGEIVRRGQPLYRVDPQPYVAQVASARAAVARARAAIASSAALQRRYGELVRINAISRQDFDNAITSAQQARADVAAQQAALRTAQIDLSRTTIRAPISGRIGRSITTAGALVTAGQTDALTTIQRLDPIFVDVPQASADVLKLRREIMAGEVARGGRAARVRLKLEDGSDYGLTGTLQFADVTVDPTTGTQTLRAVFPNPRGLLLPGMYVRAELVEGTRTDALLVPQRAVSRNEKGQPTVMVVGRGNRLEQRTLTAPRSIGQDWLVIAGLSPGERIVMSGLGRAKPGTAVKPVPWREPRGAATAPPQPGR